jgi:hypothetical protein
VVDFGAGTGHFLNTLRQKRSDLVLWGIEPFMTPSQPLADHCKYVGSFAALEAGEVGAVTALEVCEHLTANELHAFLYDVDRVLAPDGVLIVSVPIMVGFAILPKELNRMITFRRRSEYSVREVITALCGGSVEPPANPKPTHKGFDFRRLEDKIGAVFSIKEQRCSPFAGLPWWLNSQLFFICQKRSK